MRLLRHYDDVPADARGSVCALGNFDGVHRGHQAVVAAGKAEAARLGAKLAVVSFEPHPRSFFAPAGAPFRLTSLRSKARLLAECGVDILFALRFDLAFSQLSAADFVAEVLDGGLGARHLVAGYNFAFGHRRAGNAAMLEELARRRGLGVSIVGPVTAAEQRFSSSRIRDLLGTGHPRQAAELLGHWWEIDGRVEPGDRRGRAIGFPTANVALGEFLEPRFGVYAVRAGIDEEGPTAWRDGVANIGHRPTFGVPGVTLEVHCFDFAGDLYGKHLRVAFVDFLRPERKFDGIAALKAQIGADAAAARKVLAAPENAAQRFG